MDSLKDFFAFLEASPSAAHAGEEVAKRLKEAGYTQLEENAIWHLDPGGKYYVMRGFSAVIAFRVPEDPVGAMLVASHSDSPTFHINPDPENKVVGAYTRLSVEKYGGMLCASWMDRPLSVAGTLTVRTEKGIEIRTVKVERDLLIIPSVAIHMNRNANDGATYNPAVDMQPLFGDGRHDKGALLAIVAEAAGVSPDQIVNYDLGLYNRQKGTVLGGANELICAPRLDDLACAYTSLVAFLTAEESKMLPLYVLFDNEEVGSATRNGADSTFLTDVLDRILDGIDTIGEGGHAFLANSFLVSADNAHARHPNHPELADPMHAPTIGGGVVVKYNANRRYVTDGTSAAVFEEICRRAGVKTQSYCNRADMPGGSTLGSIAETHLSLHAVDIGLPQLAMHASCETAGVADMEEMINALRAVYGTTLHVTNTNIEIL